MQFNRALTSLSEKKNQTNRRDVFCATININNINLNNKASAMTKIHTHYLTKWKLCRHFYTIRIIKYKGFFLKNSPILVEYWINKSTKWNQKIFIFFHFSSAYSVHRGVQTHCFSTALRQENKCSISTYGLECASMLLVCKTLDRLVWLHAPIFDCINLSATKQHKCLH